MEEAIEIGKWLEFEAGTCFGSRLKHFGIIVGIDWERRVAVVAVNATSQIEKLIWFADRNNIPIEDAMVDVTGDLHFSKPTGIDCHRPREVSIKQLEYWVSQGKIKKSSYNEDVRSEILQRIIEIMIRSPLVEKSIKDIIKNNNGSKND